VGAHPSARARIAAVRLARLQEWNTTSAHETFTQPRIKVAAGAVIEPMAQHRKSRA
jgi:U3 small nucleolar RNA-associated protein 14